MKAARRITVVIADDHAVVRDGLAAVIGFQKDLKVVGQAENGRKAVEVCERLKPDVAILDLMMPELSGANAVSEIRKVSPSTRIAVITSFTDAFDISMALENGALSAIAKSSSTEEFIDAIRRTSSGERVVSQEFGAALRESRLLPDLSERQRDILKLVANGYTNSEIARQHHLTQANVKFHLLTIFRKLNAANRAEAISIALRKHLIGG